MADLSVLRCFGFAKHPLGRTWSCPELLDLKNTFWRDQFGGKQFRPRFFGQATQGVGGTVGPTTLEPFDRPFEVTSQAELAKSREEQRNVKQAMEAESAELTEGRGRKSIRAGSIWVWLKKPEFQNGLPW